MSPSVPSSPPIKGSWEDLLERATKMADALNDEGIPLLQKLVDRLGQLPTSSRQANNGHLQSLWLTAIMRLHTYLTMRERYGEALALLPQIVPHISDPTERRDWIARDAEILIQAERSDEAIAVLRAKAEASNDPADRLRISRYQLRLGWLDDAQQNMEAVAPLIRQRRPEGELHAELYAQRASLALKRGQCQSAVDHYRQAAHLEGEYKDDMLRLYRQMVSHRCYDFAARLTERDKTLPIGASFWRGMALYRLGHKTEADREFLKATRVDLRQTTDKSMIELVLSFYYLGDPLATALHNVLRAMQDSPHRDNWLGMLLAALGWVLRDNLTNARANLILAVNYCKGEASGSKLPYHYWLHVQDLAPAPMLENLAEFFDTEAPPWMTVIS